MDIDLSSFGQTLALGGFTVFGTVLFAKLFGRNLVSKFVGKSAEKLLLHHAALYLALTFGSGILMEDLSKELVAERHPMEKRLLTTLNGMFLDTENELRFRSLFDVTEWNDSYWVKAKPIVRELMALDSNNPAIRANIRNIGERISLASAERRFAKDEMQRSSIFCESVNSIYYVAKNLSYRNDNYYHELSNTFARIEFTRSLVFVCLVFAILHAIAALVFAIRLAGLWSLKKWVASLPGEPQGGLPAVALEPQGPVLLKRAVQKVSGDLKDFAQQVSIPTVGRRLTRTSVLSAVYVLSAYTCGIAYRSESINYDLRVFGYYFSIMQDEKQPHKPDAPVTDGVYDLTLKRHQ